MMCRSSCQKRSCQGSSKPTIFHSVAAHWPVHILASISLSEMTPGTHSPPARHGCHGQLQCHGIVMLQLRHPFPTSETPAPDVRDWPRQGDRVVLLSPCRDSSRCLCFRAGCVLRHKILLPVLLNLEQHRGQLHRANLTRSVDCFEGGLELQPSHCSHSNVSRPGGKFWEITVVSHPC